MCELLIKLATFWLAATRSLLDAFSQPTSQPEASQPSPKQACSIHARPLWPSLGLFGPRVQWSVQRSVQWSNGRSNDAMVGPMAQWSVQWSNGRSCPMVGPMIQWPVVVMGCIYIGVYWGLLLPCLCEGLGPPPPIPATPPILRPQPPSPLSRDPSKLAAAAPLRAFRESLRFCVPRFPARILGPGATKST